MERIYEALKKTVLLLCHDKYDSFFSGIYTSRIENKDYVRVLTEYGGVLTTPPDDSFIKANVIKANDAKTYTVEYELWIDDVESDLSLILEISLNDSGEINNIEVSDLLVL